MLNFSHLNLKCMFWSEKLSRKVLLKQTISFDFIQRLGKTKAEEKVFQLFTKRSLLFPDKYIVKVDFYSPGLNFINMLFVHSFNVHKCPALNLYFINILHSTSVITLSLKFARLLRCTVQKSSAKLLAQKLLIKRWRNWPPSNNGEKIGGVRVSNIFYIWP